MKGLLMLCFSVTTVVASAAEFTVMERYRPMAHWDMNNLGHTAGSTGGNQGESFATINYSGTTIRRFQGRTGQDSNAWSLSDNGVLVGSSFDRETSIGRSGYWLEDGVFRLVPPTSTGTYATASLTNSRGWIVGYADGQVDRNYGLHIFRNGQTMAIGNPTPGYDVLIHDFANDGTIVGESRIYNEEGGTNAFTWYWKEGQGFHVEPGGPNRTKSYEQANGNGLLAGRDFTTGDSIWTELNGVQTFSGFRGVLNDINDRGDLCINPSGPLGSGLVRNGRFSAFADNNLGVDAGAGILNDRGQALGEAYIGGRWTPAIFTPVPEPGTWAAFLAGGALLYRRRRR